MGLQSIIVMHQKIRDLPSKAVFYSRMSLIEGCLPFKLFFHQKLSSIKGPLLFIPGKVIFHWRLCSFFLFDWVMPHSDVPPPPNFFWAPIKEFVSLLLHTALDIFCFAIFFRWASIWTSVCPSVHNNFLFVCLVCPPSPCLCVLFVPPCWCVSFVPPCLCVSLVPPWSLRHWDTGIPGQWDTGTMGHQNNGWGGVPTYCNRIVIFSCVATLCLALFVCVSVCLFVCPQSKFRQYELAVVTAIALAIAIAITHSHCYHP